MNIYEMRKTSPKAPFRIQLQAIARGTVMPASLIYSDMCAAASKPVDKVSMHWCSNSQLTHTDTTINGRYLANHKTQTHRVPPAIVGELGESHFGPDLLINKPRLLVCLFVCFVIKQLIKPRDPILAVNQALYRLVWLSWFARLIHKI